MSLEIVVTRALMVLGIYLAVGLIYGLYFVTVGVNKVDPSATSGTKGFRILILPAVTALWPYLIMRQMKGKPPVEKNPHRKAARRGGEA